MLASVDSGTSAGSCDLPEESLSDHYDILNIVSYGRMSKIYLAAERETGSEVALKAVCRDMCRRRDVQREYHYASHLLHPNIEPATSRLFQTDLYLVYPMEYTPYGDLASFLSSRTIDEVPTRWVAEQIASALTYLHGFQLVHGCVTPDNVLIFRPNLSLVKLSDFGATCRGGALVRRRPPIGPYVPPELSRNSGTECYYANTSHDSWALGVLIIHCLIGNKPWPITDVNDPEYAAFRNWQRVKSTRVPRPFKRFTVRLLRLLRRLLEPHSNSRYPAKEVFKYIEDDWMIKSRDRSDSHDFTSSLVPLHNPRPSPPPPGGDKAKDSFQTPQQEREGQEQVPQSRVSSPRRFLVELLRFSSPTTSTKHQRKTHTWHHSSSSSSSSSSFSWLNSSSSTSSFSTSTNYSSV